MAKGKWIELSTGPRCYCYCGDELRPGDDTYQTRDGIYCSEACADEHENSNHGSFAPGVAHLLLGG